jgi:hypothetical protein
MIRNIMGCLMYVGQGTKPVEWMQQVLDARSREVAAPTFSPDGLYFLGPIYDARWGLPTDTPRLPGCPERPRAFDGCYAWDLPCIYPRTRIKICGLTREQDVDAAGRRRRRHRLCALRPSPRAVTPRARPTGPAPAALCHAGAAVRERNATNVIAACTHTGRLRAISW